MCALGASALAQSAVPQLGPGRIWPWNFIRSAKEMATYKPATPDLTAIEANMQKLVDVVKAVPLLNPPLGYDVRFTGTLNSADPPVAKHVTANSYTVDLAFMDFLRSPTDPAVKTAFANQGLSFHINDPYRALDASGYRDPVFMRKTWSDDEGEFWIEPPSDNFNGLRFYRPYDMLVVTKGGASLWKPISAERFLPKYLDEKRADATQAEARLVAARKTYDQANSADAQASRQKAIDAARARANGEAEARGLDESYRRQLETLKGEASPSQSNPDHKWYFGPKQALADAEAMAAALTPQARKMPACVTGYLLKADRWAFKMVPDGTAGCRRIVEVDFGLFDNKLPPSAIQMIVVANLSSCEKVLKGPDEVARSWPGGCKGTVEIANQIDWKKMAGLLEK